MKKPTITKLGEGLKLALSKLKKYDWWVLEKKDGVYGFYLFEETDPLEEECVAELRAKTPSALVKKIIKLLNNKKL